MGNPQLFTSIFNRYLDNNCSPEEMSYLVTLMQSEEYRSLAGVLIEQKLAQQPAVAAPDPSLEQRLDKRLQAIFASAAVQPVQHRSPVRIWWWAAAASVVLAFSIAFYQFVLKSDQPENFVVAKVTTPESTAAKYTRHITLPDGSTVVLHADSKLGYPDSFTQTTREVTLSGEAYFDIVHNPNKPFVIYTGNVRTTVLGTAFNIKSDERQITVSVTRGKVKVERGSETLAVLTQDQQVQYNVPEALPIRHAVDAAAIVTDWTREDMVFNGISFEEIAGLLSKRYGVSVQFKNESLRKCKIRASFSGTETLQQVATVLSGIRNGKFEQLQDGTILFDGEGCE